MLYRSRIAYSFAKRPFNAAKAPLARARRIQGEVDDLGAEDAIVAFVQL